MKAVVAAFNQEKALVGAFSVITNIRMEIFEALSRNSLEVRDQSPPLNLNIDMMEDSDSANNEDSGFTSIKVGGDRMLIANNISLAVFLLAFSITVIP